MRFRPLVACLGIGLGLAAPTGTISVRAADAAAGLRASKPAVKQEIVTVIEAQLAAFRKGDVAKAYTYAASELRAQKPLRNFTAIVKENYPEIWASTRAEPGIVRDNGAQATVTVQVYSKTGDAAYDFTLVKEPAGWRIQGVLRHEPRRGGTVRFTRPSDSVPWAVAAQPAPGSAKGGANVGRSGFGYAG